MGKLNNKVAIVTGGSRGIGAAIARALANEGADVAISYASSDQKAQDVVRDLQATGVRAAAYRADQSDPANGADLVQRVVDDFGRLDILINNAGFSAAAPIDSEDVDEDALDRHIAVNYQGAVAAIRAAFPLLPEGGRIVNISTGAASRAGFPGMADYTASKAALESYSRGAARDLAHRGITVNTVKVGFIDTDMNPADGPASSMFLPTTAMGRYGRPEEVAAGVVFLASPDASYITGAGLNIDGGYAA
ncbi:MAG: SDR family NAD(P)-dependent oxidoreductase [Corynebacterium sp.]|uniref:SDR family NAD(P)-dependent oxidoreductase n=1 Tax=Corynebacterium sp. TaxID=1720 RepID=UPI003F963B65